jgi:YD repeat-containing protein
MGLVLRIHYTNGHLNITIPLVDVGGRGDARETLQLPIESHWRVETSTYAYNCPQCQFGTAYMPVNLPWDGGVPIMVGGKLVQRSLGDTCAPGGDIAPGRWWNTLTRLTLILPDGTEHEFRDLNTGGLKQGILEADAPNPPNNLNDFTARFDRGTMFQALDGSAALFVSNNDVLDYPRGGCQATTASNGSIMPVGDGVVYLRDGTRYTVANGYVRQIKDRNGNLLALPDPTAYPQTITDGLGRDITITAPGATQTITYPGTGGSNDSRQVTITYDLLSNLLLSGSTQTMEQLFGYIDWNCKSSGCPNVLNSDTPYEAIEVASVIYPNGKGYRFRYNAYGDVAQVALPTGGIFKYYYDTFIQGVGALTQGNQYPGYVIQRYLTKKEVYQSDGTTLSQQVVYSPPSGQSAPASGHVVYQAANGAVLSVEDHFTNGVNVQPPVDGTAYKNWDEGKEYRTDVTDAGGTLRSEQITWQEQPCSWCWWVTYPMETTPEFNPRIGSKTVTLGTQTSQENYYYDQYNNETERDEFDFAATGVGPLLRSTVTQYQYFAIPAYIVDLPSVRQVCSAAPGSPGSACATANVLAEADYSYDETGYTLQNAPGIGNHDDTNYSASSTVARGNATTVTQIVKDAVNGNTSLASHYRYDIAGNMVATMDPRGVQHTYGYADSGSGPGNTYSLPTSVTSYTGVNTNLGAFKAGTPPGGALPTVAAAYNYWIGKPSSTTDLNGQTTTYSYSDALGRLTGIQRPDASQTNFVYHDTEGDVSVDTIADRVDPQDHDLVSSVHYDWLGRPTRTDTPSASVTTCYDGHDRVSAVSNPQPLSNPAACPPASGVPFTTTSYDNLNRPRLVTAPDGSVTETRYAGPATLAIDAAGKTRQTTTDAAGRLIQAVENQTSWNGGGVGVSSEPVLTTNYLYDGLDDLTLVCQGGTISGGNCTGQQPRRFTYL